MGARSSCIEKEAICKIDICVTFLANTDFVVRYKHALLSRNRSVVKLREAASRQEEVRSALLVAARQAKSRKAICGPRACNLEFELISLLVIIAVTLPHHHLHLTSNNMAARFTPRLFQQATRGYASQATVRAPRQLDGLAGKYASSAYVAALSKDAKTLEKVEADLKVVQSALTGSDGAKLQTFISNPTLSGADRTKGLEQLLSQGKGKADPITQ